MRTELCVSFLLAAVVSSCDDSAAPEAAPEENAITQEKERGPVKVSLRVEPREPTFADRIRYTIAAEAPEGVELTLPEAGAGLSSTGDAVDASRFIIRDFQGAPPAPTAEGNERREQTYTLEVVTSGEFTIPAAEISFVDRRRAPAAGAGDAPGPIDGEGPAAGGDEPIDREGAGTGAETGEEKVFKIVTDPIALTVRSLEDVAAIEDLRPIEGPAEPPALPPGLKWPLIGAGVLAGVAALAVVVVLLARRKSAPPPPLPPEEIAYRELEWLLAQRFTDRGELREFYFHLSRIVREYIERRFGLRAPERTTEEFLEELRGSDALDPRHRGLLERFLERADLVKFARYTPAAEEISASFEAAKEFIAETRRRPEEVAGAAR